MQKENHMVVTASQVMDPNPVVLHTEETIRQGISLVMNHRYRNIPVVDSEGHYLGIFGVNCLLRLVLPRAALLEGGLTSVPFVTDSLRDLRVRLHTVEDKPVTYCMSENFEVVAPDTHLVETMLKLYKTRSSLPVVEPESGCLVGMISYWDIGARILEQEI